MRLILIACMMLGSTAAYAAPARTDADADAAARRAKPAGAKVDAIYEFELDNVTGDALSPDHQPVRTRVTGSHESMIQLRMHFIPQMLQMANDV